MVDENGPIELWLGRGEMTERSITMHWALDERVDVAGYTLHRLPFDDAIDPMIVALDPTTVIHSSTDVSLVDTEVETGARYWYILLADDTTGSEHRRAAEAHAVTDLQAPNPITGLTVEIGAAGTGEAEVTLRWDRSDDNYRFDRYTIRRSVDGADSVYYGTGWTVDQMTFVDDQLPPAGSVLVYEVGATDFHGNVTEPATIEITVG